MSFADKVLSDMVAPVPEHALEDRTGHARVVAERSYRAFARMKTQQIDLSDQAQKKGSPSSEEGATAVLRRIPHPPTSSVVPVKIPREFRALPSTTTPEITSKNPVVPRSPAKDARLNITRMKVQLSAKQPALPDQTLVPQRPQTQPPITSPPRVPVAKPLSASERIGNWFSPTANIRSVQRNARMRPTTDSLHSRATKAVEQPTWPEEWRQQFGKDPSLSRFLPLEEFDDSELEIRSPQEWVEMGRHCGGTPARSQFFVVGSNDENGNITWAPCRVQEYNEEENSFLIRWESSAQLKWVKRLNLIFDDEDERLWHRRVAQAEALRAEAEAQLRLWLYVDSQGDGLVAPVDEEQVDRILALVAAEFPVAHLPVMDRVINEMRQMYTYGVKRAIFDYEWQDPAEQTRLAALNLPPPLPPPEQRIVGTLELPPHDFNSARRFIEENLFFTHHLLYHTVYAIVGKWDQFSADILCDVTLKTVSHIPCQLSEFRDLQLSVVERVSQRLKKDWSINITTTVQNDLDEHFNFYEDNLQAYQASRMCRFFRTINLIMSHQLRSLILLSIRVYVGFLRQYELYPVRDLDSASDSQLMSGDPSVTLGDFLRRPSLVVAQALRDAHGQSIGHAMHGTDVQLGSSVTGMTNTISGNVSLFVIKLTAGHTRRAEFEPLLEDVELEVKSVIDNFFKYTDDILGVGDKLFPLLNLGEFYLRSLSPGDPTVEKAKATVHKILEENMAGPKALKALYEPFEYLLQADLEVYVEEFNSKHIVEGQFDDDAGTLLIEYEREMNRLSTDVDRIRARSLNEVSFKLVKVECYEIKNTLMRRAQEIAAALMRSLAERTKDEMNEVGTSYEEIYEQIQTEPNTPEELRDLKTYITNCGTEIKKLQRRFDGISRAVEVLGKFGFMFDEADFQTYWETYSWPKKVFQMLDDSEFRLKENHNRFQKELRVNTEQLTEDISALASAVDSFTVFSDESRAEDYYEKVKQMRSKIQEYKSLIQLYNSREQLFGLPTTPWSHIHEITKAFEPFQQLWTIAYEQSQQFPQWHEGLFNQLDPDAVEANVLSWLKTLHGLVKKLKDYDGPQAVAKHICEKLEQFKPLLPLLHALRNPGLRDRHWKRISGKVGETIKPKDDMTLNNFLALNLQNHMQDIQEISEYASKEYRLEKQMEKMQADWRIVQFEVAPHHDTYVLKSVDDIQQLLDDHIVKTQTMLGSPFVKAIENQVKTWETKLLRIQSTIDEWLKCQGTWVYLDAIFVSGDIQKSMPAEAQKFQLVNTMWHQCMDTTVKNPYVMNRSQEERLLYNFIEANKLLDSILKQLHQFLETKRIAFPRFYFISNEELLEILSESRDPLLVQPYLRKCFEGIDQLHFERNLDITKMKSSMGEVVKLIRATNPADHNNAVEIWLERVERNMQETIRETCRKATQDFLEHPREEWILRWPGMVAITISQLFWTRDVEDAMRRDGLRGLEQEELNLNQQMDRLIEMVRGDLEKVHRVTLEALVVIDVHARDIVTELRKDEVEDESNFSWLAQLRYYWEGNDLIVRQINAAIPYGYEYLGNTGRLVITPLTDRCYRTLMGALHLNLGGAPEGPAGTGKTETTKDLGKAIARQCVVYNCSEQISFREMAKLFKGLAASGAWACFDEFNRIEIQTLSVIAQQILTIQQAIQRKSPEFTFEGQLVKLKPGCSVFITMNPGYAGRAELPDNLKALFRPVAMMVPDYAMIAEISLFSFGFKKGRDLARKIVATYKLCSEQLSSQDHYDYGMRAVKAVLTAAGRLKRMHPADDEHVLLLTAINDVNLPKFLSQDVSLFEGIVSDLFPGVKLAVPEYTHLREACLDACQTFNLQPTQTFLTKVFQLYETIIVRHGLMVVGYSFAGKSSALKVLSAALTLMSGRHQGEDKTQMVCINPKSITMGQLYGQNDVSLEWNDGVLSKVFRNFAQDNSKDRKWIVLDGPVDALWIENMNTVLDDNKKLCLVNGDIIPMTQQMNMIFEVQDLLAASPATVSRCGMVYMEPTSLGWEPLFEAWLRTLPDLPQLVGPATPHLRTLVPMLVTPSLDFAFRQGQRLLPLSKSSLVASMLRILHTFFQEIYIETNRGTPVPATAFSPEERDVQIWIEGWVLFSIVWSIGASLDSVVGRRNFSQFLYKEVATQHELAKRQAQTEANQNQSSQLKEGGAGYKFLGQLPDKRTLFEYVFQRENGGRWVDWMDTIPEFKIPERAKFHEIIVPTTDTARYSFLLSRGVQFCQPFLFCGDTGTGKTMMIKDTLLAPQNTEKLHPIFLQFSAQTTANQAQAVIESKLEKRRKAVYGPPIGKLGFIFVDDLNMPALEEYGAQPPVELLRQWLDYRGWYEHRKDNVNWKEIQDIMFVAAMGPPGGGRNPVTARILRHFSCITVTSFDDITLKRVFGILTDWMLSAPGYPGAFRQLSANVVQATIDVYQTVLDSLLPTPEKSHYTFNLRDLSKVFQGISMAGPDRVKDEAHLARLWLHECERVFADRLVENDGEWFRQVCHKALAAHLKRTPDSVLPRHPLLFADWMEHHTDDRVYEELADPIAATAMLEAYLEEYNSNKQKKMKLVVFDYVAAHVARISRILKQPFGHALLIGVGGSGRQSATRLAVFIADYRLFEIQLTKQYRLDSWRDDMKQLLRLAGSAQGQPTAFLFLDSQIKEESFLEDLSNLLNTGEIPNLFAQDELDQIADGLLPLAKELRREPSKRGLLNLFVERCRVNLHVVLCFSPIGSTLRNRLRKFPALVNCCTIDWFAEWPVEGLRSVAAHFLEDLALDSQMKSAVMDVCVHMHQSVRRMASKYLAEYRQHFYVTPTYYSELLLAFKSLLVKKRLDISTAKNRYDTGLEQLMKTEEEVEEMTRTLELLKPNLLRTAKETEELIVTIEKESAEAEKTRGGVAVEEQACQKKAGAAKAIFDDCDAQLAEVMPALEAAQRAVSDLSKKELGEIRSLAAPSDRIKRVIEAVCVMLDEQPKRAVDQNMRVTFDYWEVAKKKVMANTDEFRNRLVHYDVENISDNVIEKIQPYIKDRSFRPSEVKSLSMALVGLCQWVIAVEKFYRVNKIVKPKKELLTVAQREYADAEADLKSKKDELSAVDEHLRALQKRLDDNMLKKQELEEEYANTESKLVRATKLMSGLGGEKTRYVEQSERLAEVYSNVVGDVLISAGFTAYLGPFVSQYRQSLVTEWVSLCHQRGIPGTQQFELSKFLGDAVRIQEWKLLGLPSDPFSVDNAIVITNARRWPLLIDPQGQANNWIKNMEREKKLVTVRPTEGEYHKSITQAIRAGIPVLLENVEEEIDPVLEPLLLKQVLREGGTASITIGDSTVEYNDSFKFYMTTKLPRPHYRPEVSTKVALVNFAITPLGLQDQLLQKVVAFEEKEVEEKKQKYVQQSAINKSKLKAIEDEILKNLSTETNLLENEEVINTLDSSKIVADEISAKQVEIENAEAKSDKTRNKFLPVASRASALFFCITDLANIDPMYQWSLQWYIEIFSRSLRDSEPAPDNRDVRIVKINTYFQYVLYRYVCRSLFAKDVLLFSFLMCAKLSEPDSNEFRFLLTGGLQTETETPPSPAPWIPEKNWKSVCRMAEQLPQAFRALPTHMLERTHQWHGFMSAERPHETPLPGDWEKLDPFRKLIMVRVLRPEGLIPAITNYVLSQTGDSRYVQAPLLNLSEVFYDSPDPWVPFVFILSPGADPMGQLKALAEQAGHANKLESLSLGSGMGDRARQKINEGKQHGNWVLLQNCHLYSDWMPQLQRIVEDYWREDARKAIHNEFRLWLTSLPSEAFPSHILQNGVKMIQEPPKGLKANLLRSFTSEEVLADPKTFTEACTKPREWKKLAFGLAFFHAVVQERRSFGPLGWNIPYEFNQTDLAISLKQIIVFLNESQEVPFDALTYLIGHCNYGGRVTEDFDRRTLMCILSDFITEDVLDDRYKLASSAYLIPRDGPHESYIEYINGLPLLQKPEIFGFHANADITKAEREAQLLLDAILMSQPSRDTATSSNDSQNAAEPTDVKSAVLMIVQEMLGKFPPPFNVEEALRKYPLTYSESMNTVLVQELFRYNRLADIISSSLRNLTKAIQGQVLMSSQLEDVFTAIYDSKIPKLWAKNSYPSLKPLGGYFNDLTRRLQFFQQWLTQGPPPVFWLSGFYFTQSFLTGVLQNFARRGQIEIDTLKWDFTMMDNARYESPPTEGCYVDGLFLQGAGWDPQRKVLCEQKPRVQFQDFPIVWLRPVRQENLREFRHYECPLYKTSERRGVLSTTGHSTNFVMTFKLPTDTADEKHWVKRGTALLCQLDY
eukprot:TRINITY_DN14772_c0_g1_i1.p1 TRINITY_DN14772_c0_g1~~TRINITY_DN14772_c0_g1_i1.p1  ORF type:complete len:4302 (+),score=681.03 TRINITY_DN14772_c0_g1_i1:35-12907(+)